MFIVHSEASLKVQQVNEVQKSITAASLRCKAGPGCLASPRYAAKQDIAASQNCEASPSCATSRGCATNSEFAAESLGSEVCTKQICVVQQVPNCRRLG
jgi:hypothetical protein